MSLQLKQIPRSILNIGIEETDNEELKLQKSLLALCSILFIIAGLLWGIMYVVFGESFSGLIPIAYSVLSLCSLIYFSKTKKFKFFRFSQLVLVLFLPFLLMLSLGGFVNGSVVIIWSLLSPMGALMFDKQPAALPWLIGFILLVSLSLFLQPYISSENNLSSAQISGFLVTNLTAVGGLIFIMINYFVKKRNYYQQRSENLILNILPKQIAEELKEYGAVDPMHYSSVTVMFTDFKNFTHMAETMDATDLVCEIDTIYTAFDRIIQKHNIEKIKTIGDAYMCAAGLPKVNTTHAFDMIEAAIEILQYTQNRIQERNKMGKQSFDVRIGIHSGEVIAGIVGETKFAYDIWGDAVNTAARMESSGETGKINISGNTYQLVKEKFNCTYRGKIKAKNKGEIDMYFVEL